MEGKISKCEQMSGKLVVNYKQRECNVSYLEVDMTTGKATKVQKELEWFLWEETFLHRVFHWRLQQCNFWM